MFNSWDFKFDYVFLFLNKSYLIYLKPIIKDALHLEFQVQTLPPCVVYSKMSCWMSRTSLTGLCCLLRKMDFSVFSFLLTRVLLYVSPKRNLPYILDEVNMKSSQREHRNIQVKKN